MIMKNLKLTFTLLGMLLTHAILGQAADDKQYEEEMGRYIAAIKSDNEKERQYIPKTYEYLGNSHNAIIDELKKNGADYKMDKTNDGSKDVIVVDLFGDRNKDKVIVEAILYFDKSQKCEKVESVKPVPYSLENANYIILTINSVEEERRRCIESELCEMEKYTFFDLPVYKWKRQQSYYSVPYVEDVDQDGMIDIVTFLYFRDAPKP